VISPLLLGTDKELIPLYLVAALCLGSVLAPLSLAVGSAFPKPRFEHLVQIETSFGGFLFGVLSLVAVALTLAVFASPIHYFFQVNYLHKVMDKYDYYWLTTLGAVYLGICLASGMGSWWWAKRSWNNLSKSMVA
ncbi:MAG: hypothetical protein AABZ44_08755, partial [Elusimicrobiota bacterium]